MDTFFCSTFNLLGFVSSVATAYVYEFVHRADTIEDKCIVHLAASLAMAEFVIFTNCVFGYSRYSLMRDAAKFITLFIFSAYLWSSILAFQVRKKFISKPDAPSKKSEFFTNDSEYMKKYSLICYGITFLCFLCYLGDLTNDSKDAIMQLSIFADIAITIINGVILVRVSSDLLRQIDSAKASLKNNDPVKVDIKQAKYRQQFTYRLFKILVLPWFILWLVLMFVSAILDYRALSSLALYMPLALIGLQGILLFSHLVLHRKRIWRDLEMEYGWKKPEPLRNMEKMLGYISEDDDDEEVMNAQTRWDLLATFHNMTKKNEPTVQEANTVPTSIVNSGREAPNMQPAIHQYVGQKVFTGGADHTDDTKKLMNAMV